MNSFNVQVICRCLFPEHNQKRETSLEMKCPKVSIIVLNFNGEEDTMECLESLKKINYPNCEIILVDNGSTDGSVESLKKTYPEIGIIENGSNLGFSEGNNEGIRKAMENKTDYILMLNNDTIVDPGFLAKLIKAAERDSKIGVVGPVIYHYNDANKIQSAGSRVSLKTGECSLIKEDRIIKDNSKEPYDVDYVVGCALLAKSKLFEEIGELNKAYFAYWEETDWCFRVRKRGYKVLCVPGAKIWHKGGATSKKTSGFTEYHMGRNMFWFMKTHATRKQYTIFLIYFFCFKMWSYSFVKIRRKNVPELVSYLNGIKKGILTYH